MRPVRTPEAVAVVDAAVDAHGGLDRWRTARRLEVQLAFGGLAFYAKGRRKASGRPFTASIDTVGGGVTMRPFANSPAMVGEFTRERLRILDSETGTPIEECPTDSRRSGLLRTVIPWKDLDQLFFGGYAISHYFRLPFSLIDEAIGLKALPDQRGLRRVQAMFPEEVYPHSPQEMLHFDRSGRLVRHDYVARFLSPLARGAHLSEDYGTFDGLAFARRRRVRLNLAGFASRPTVLWGEISDVRILDH